MKKLFILGLSVVMASGAIVSCSKTSKGKMSNDWKVDSWKSTTTTTQNNGSKTESTESHNGSTLTTTTITTPNGGSPTTTTSTKDVNAHTYVISKDGTWSSEYTTTGTQTTTIGGVNVVTVTKREATLSGSWNFLGKIDEFKKNERVIFHTLNSKVVTTTTVTPQGGTSQTSTSTDSNTFSDGLVSNVYIVVESKNKELQLKTEDDYTITETSGGTTTTTTVKGGSEMTLTEM